MVRSIDMKKHDQSLGKKTLTINQNRDNRDDGLCWRTLHGTGEAGLYQGSNRTLLREFDLLKRRYALRFLANPVTTYFWPLNEWGYRQR